MGIKLNEKTGTYTVSYAKRHPITRLPKRICRKNIKTKAEASRVYAEIVVKMEEKLFGPPPGTMLYGDLLRKFNDSLIARGLAQQTIDNYIFCLKLHTKNWNSRPIDSIKTEEIRHLVKVQLADRAPSQQKSVLKYIRGIFNYGVESDLLIRNPVPRITFKLGDKIKKVLSQPQAKIFLEKAKQYNHEWYPIWFVALYTGMRNGELHSLTWDKVDFDNETILVSSTWNKKDGIKELTKSGEDRIIDLAPALKAFLQELKIKNYDSLFVLPRLQAWDIGRQAEILRMFLTSIGLPEVRFHDLRASWATMLLSRGIEPAKVMKLGGWKDLKTMMIYLRKAGIDTRGTLKDFNIHDASEKTGSVLEFKTLSL